LLVSLATSGNGWASFFWTAFARSANPMVVLEGDRVIVALNPAFSEAFGHQPQDWVGRSADSWVAPEQWQRLERDWTEVKRTGRLCGQRELVRADGRHVAVQFALQGANVSGRRLFLFVTLEMHLRPLTHEPADGTSSVPLTARELQVVAEVAMGLRAHEIAAQLNIAPSTVQTHVRNAMGKVGARSQAQLVAIALATGMLHPDAVKS
jgi:PAS domain S-box-containing protein